jgi:hypothetical protein
MADPEVPTSARVTGSPTPSGRGPSAPWLGALSSLFGIGAFVWFLLYTWDFAPVLRPLGGWNYAISAGLVVAASICTNLWRGA